MEKPPANNPEQNNHSTSPTLTEHISQTKETLANVSQALRNHFAKVGENLNFQNVTDFIKSHFSFLSRFGQSQEKTAEERAAENLSRLGSFGGRLKKLGHYAENISLVLLGVPVGAFGLITAFYLLGTPIAIVTALRGVAFIDPKYKKGYEIGKNIFKKPLEAVKGLINEIFVDAKNILSGIKQL